MKNVWRSLPGMRNMLHRLENRIDCKFRGGIGRVKSWENVKDSYTEALRALREGNSHVVHINDIPIVKDYDGEYPLELENRFLQRAMEQVMQGQWIQPTGFLSVAGALTEVQGRH